MLSLLIAITAMVGCYYRVDVTALTPFGEPLPGVLVQTYRPERPTDESRRGALTNGLGEARTTTPKYLFMNSPGGTIYLRDPVGIWWQTIYSFGTVFASTQTVPQSSREIVKVDVTSTYGRKFSSHSDHAMPAWLEPLFEDEDSAEMTDAPVFLITLHHQ